MRQLIIQVPQGKGKDVLAIAQKHHATNLAQIAASSPDRVAKQVTNVEFRSPVEVFLSGLQSVGSWKGLLGYAALAAVVVWKRTRSSSLKPPNVMPNATTSAHE